MQALRGRALAAAADAEEFYEDGLGAVAGLPRVEMHSEHFVVDRRHISGKYAVRVTDPDPDGGYTIGLDLGWQLVDAARCDAVRDDTTCPSPVVAAYLAYVNHFTDLSPLCRTWPSGPASPSPGSTAAPSKPTAGPCPTMSGG